MLKAVVAAMVIGATFSPAWAATGTAAPWRALTRIDVQAAYRLLHDNHPGAVPGVHDEKFVAALAAAHKKALMRAAAVADYPGYRAALDEFANSMGDGHIWSTARYLPRTVAWTGLIPAKRGAQWVIAADYPKFSGVKLAGARLVSCDGLPVATLARNALHFRTDTSVSALEALNAPWILVDDGNPFLKRPRICVFAAKGRTRRIALRWRRIDYIDLWQHYWKVPAGKAGFGVRRLGRGYWIAIQSLEAKAQGVIDAAKAQARALRRARFVVVDLRGNGGGDDSYGRALADVLYGRGYVERVLGPGNNNGSCPEVYRASAGNIAALTKEAAEFRQDGDIVGAEGYARAIREMKAARARGQVLTGPAICTRKAASAAPSHAASLMHAPVIVLTDSVCFSSCINTVGFFRKLGAVQAGQETGADTHYAEVREIVLPSGLSTFSTLQAIAPDAPARVGPYAPAYPYSGDIADTAALETWIAHAVVPKLAASR